jgi:hypothetical protein
MLLTSEITKIFVATRNKAFQLANGMKVVLFRCLLGAGLMYGGAPEVFFTIKAAKSTHCCDLKPKLKVTLREKA